MKPILTGYNFRNVVSDLISIKEESGRTMIFHDLLGIFLVPSGMWPVLVLYALSCVYELFSLAAVLLYRQQSVDSLWLMQSSF